MKKEFISSEGEGEEEEQPEERRQEEEEELRPNRRDPSHYLSKAATTMETNWHPRLITSSSKGHINPSSQLSLRSYLFTNSRDRTNPRSSLCSPRLLTTRSLPDSCHRPRSTIGRPQGHPRQCSHHPKSINISKNTKLRPHIRGMVDLEVNREMVMEGESRLFSLRRPWTKAGRR